MQGNSVKEEVIFENGFVLQFFLNEKREVVFTGVGPRGGSINFSQITLKDAEDFIDALNAASKKIIKEDLSESRDWNAGWPTLSKVLISPVADAYWLGKIEVCTRKGREQPVVAELHMNSNGGAYKQMLDVSNPYLLQELARKLDSLLNEN